MKKFDLEAAKQGKKVVTRDGQEVSQITKFEVENILYALRGVVGGKDIQSWTDYGKFRASGEMHPLDLFMATEKKTVWIAVSNDECGGAMRLTTNVCYSEDELQKYFGRATVMSEPHQIVSFEIEV